MSLKYIAFESPLYIVVIVFPEHIGHDLIATSLRSTEPTFVPINAGYVSVADGKATAWGTSNSLGIKSDATSDAYLTKLLFGKKDPKYILFENPLLGFFPIVFPDHIEHTTIANAIRTQEPGNKPITAGFVAIEKQTAKVHGNSTSLQLAASKDDNWFVQKALFGE